MHPGVPALRWKTSRHYCGKRYLYCIFMGGPVSQLFSFLFFFFCPIAMSSSDDRSCFALLYCRTGLHLLAMALNLILRCQEKQIFQTVTRQQLKTTLVSVKWVWFSRVYCTLCSNFRFLSLYFSRKCSLTQPFMLHLLSLCLCIICTTLKSAWKASSHRTITSYQPGLR